MKRILLILLATTLHCAAVNDYLAHSAGSISGPDSILFETSGGTTYRVTASQLQTFAQSGTLSSSSINAAALTALGNAVNVSGGILTFSGIGSTVEAWDGNPPTAGYILSSTTGGTRTWVAPAIGTVTSVALAAPAAFTVSGSPVTGSGTLTISYSGTAIPVSAGGSGQVSFAVDGLLCGGTTTTSPFQTIAAGTSGQFLMSNGTGSLPTWSNGSTGITTVGTLTSGSIPYSLLTGTPTIPTAGTGLTNSSGSFNVNSSQSISTLSNLTSNGLVTTSGGAGTLSVTGSGSNVLTAISAGMNASTGFEGWDGNPGTNGQVLSSTTSGTRSWVTPITLHAAGTPAVAGGIGAGTSPTVSVVGSDVSGVITVLTGGSGESASSTIVTLTFNTAYGTAPNAVTLTPANATTSALAVAAQAFVLSVGTTNFVVSSNTTALTALTSYKWYYSVPQQ